MNNNQNLIKAYSFERLIILVVVILVSLIFFLIYLNGFIKTKVTSINVNNEQYSADFINQRIKITFNRPMIQNELSSNIKIEPSVKFSTAWSANNLFIIFNETLNSDALYSIKITPSIKDKTGNTISLEDKYYNKITDEITYGFKTKVAEFAYIEKNYKDTNTKIVISDVNLKKKVILFEGNNIKDFGLNKKYLVVVNEKDQTNNIIIKDLQTNSIKDLGLINIKISGLDFSPTTNEFIYISQEVNVKDNYTLPRNNSLNKIIQYDLNNNTSKDFNPKNTAKDVLELKYSGDGKSILYKTSDSFYYIAQIDKTDDYFSIGRFLQLGGFNNEANKIAFINYDPLQTYTKNQFLVVFNNNKSIKTITNGDNIVIDPIFFHKNNNILVSEKYRDLESTKGIFKIEQIDENLNREDILIDDLRSLELPKPSFDDKYILIERYNSLDLLNFDNLRNYGNQSKPSFANLIIFDIKNKKVIDNNIVGINAIWIK